MCVCMQARAYTSVRECMLIRMCMYLCECASECAEMYVDEGVDVDVDVNDGVIFLACVFTAHRGS